MKQRIIRNIINFPGFKTSKKIVVIESDDWGAIRMPSKQAYAGLVEKGIINENDPFTKYDSLASEEDLEMLFDVLSSVKGADGKPVVLTADTIVANPDFEKIKESGYTEYFYEPATETLKRYPKHAKCFELWKQGMESGVYKPQLHGREHVNVLPWLNNLKEDKQGYRDAFELGTYAINGDIVAALNFTNETEEQYLEGVVNDACNIFEGLFGFKSRSFIAPNYTWGNGVEKTLIGNGIKLLQGTKKQKKPVDGGKIEFKHHYTGQKNKLKQTYLVRNCLFEPSVSPSVDYVNACLNHVSNSFYWGKPAIISSHRLNYVGYLDENNRDRNLKSLKDLLQNIVKRWPDVVFISTDELSGLIN